MGSVVDESAPDITNEQVQKDHRQQASSERAFESFGEFVPKLDSENKQNSDHSKKRARSAGRWLIECFKNEPAKHTARKTRTHSQITRYYTGNTSCHPKHDKFCRAVKFLDVWTNNPEAVHVDQQMQYVHVQKHRRNEAPPLIQRLYEVIRLGSKRQKHFVWQGG